MIEIISVNVSKLFANTCSEPLCNKFQVDFILFDKIECNCEFEHKGFNNWDEIKSYIENQLIRDFKNISQLEGKPSNLKTK